jgi:uncharacterized protein (DUF1501 family)
MLQMMRGFSRNCEGMQRRDFLRVGALAGLGLSVPQLLAAKAMARPARDVSCILVWTLGGTSHHDTFDPKPDAPSAVRGDFRPIATAVPGVRFSEILPRLARELNRFSVLRSLNPRNGAHGSADFVMMSGHRFSVTTRYPCYGSVVSHHQGFKTRMPPFVQLGSAVNKLVGGGTAGFLGVVHNPFEILGDPSAETFSAGDLVVPAGVSGERQQRRQNVFRTLDGLQRSLDSQPAGFAAMDTHYQAALDLIAAPQTREAFQLERETAQLRDDYGRNRFGQSLLLARRLVEAGVRFVTVSNDGWDTHVNNFNQLRDRLMPPVDQGLPALLADLGRRGMLDSTLVVWLTDFGRTPQINPSGGRDHWATAAFAVMAGAGTPGGTVVGRTDDEGGRPTDREYFPEDIAATIYTKLGIPLDLTLQTPAGRPIRLNEGRTIREWM